MTKTAWWLVGLALAVGCGGGTETASPELSCPTRGLPDPDPSFVDTVGGLVVVPTRAGLRDASEAEMLSFRELVGALQVACGASLPDAPCELRALRAELTTLPAPDHPDLFIAIDGSLDAALSSAHGDFAAADRDCEGQPESVCDARAVTLGLVRGACELEPDSETSGHE